MANKLGAEILCLGSEGRSIWYAHRQLVKYIDSADTVCCCYTDRHRLPNMYDWPINLGSVTYYREGDKSSMHTMRYFPDENVWKAADLYYKHIYADDYHQLTQRLIINDIDQMLADRGIYSVHMMCFEDPPIEFRSGANLDVNLYQWLQNCGKTSIDRDRDACHMSASMNAHVAQKVYDQIINQHQGKFSLDIIPYRQ